MSTTSPRTVVSVRIDPQHVEQIRRIADRNASTVSRTVARIVADRLDHDKQPSQDHENDDR